jgi:GMP synthase-like glutamine amidotransferase
LVYIGDRSKNSAEALWESFPAVCRECAVCYTDFLEAYQSVLPKKRHCSVDKKSGKTSLIEHNQQGLFRQLALPLQVTRYHSLLINHVPHGFSLDAWFDDPIYGREIMAMSHDALRIYSVQFHPESILTQQGHELLDNFLYL